MKLDLDLWEVNLILKALEKLPYEEVNTTIQKIMEQAKE